MQIDNPTWYLKQICPCCGQGYPALIACPNCNYLTAHCEETDNTFLNVQHLNAGFTEVCPRCKQIKTSDFVKATSDNILAAGFTKEDYH